MNNDLFFENNVIALAKSICSVLNRKTESQTDTGSQRFLKHCFDIDDYNSLDENIIKSFNDNCTNRNYSKLKEIFLKINNEKDISQNIKKGGDEKINRKNFGKLLKISLKEDKVKDMVKEVIKSYLKSKQKINLINLESI